MPDARKSAGEILRSTLRFGGPYRLRGDQRPHADARGSVPAVGYPLQALPAMLHSG
jgi:hypothetical protein